MAVLVGYATAHGSTQEIAERVAAKLGDGGWRAGALPLSEVDNAGAFDAFVLGSAIHGGDWLPEAGAFLDRHAETLASRPVWLFSVSTVGATSSAFGPRVARSLRRLTRVPRSVAAAWDAIGPRDHRAFAGVIRPEHWGLPGRVFLRGLGGRFGDHRDWHDVDAWARRISSELTSAERRSA